MGLTIKILGYIFEMIQECFGPQQKLFCCYYHAYEIGNNLLMMVSTLVCFAFDLATHRFGLLSALDFSRRCVAYPNDLFHQDVSDALAIELC